MRLDRETLRALAAASGIGFTIASSIAIGVLFGRWIDQKLGTEPCALIAGIVLALISAGSIVYELTSTAKRTNDAKDHLDRDDSG
jgi:F0F1-type ATP synthase assembly protein I